MIYKDICIPRISDFGKNGIISLTTALCIMEDTGAHHSTHADDDVLKFSLNGSAWVVTNWRIRPIKPIIGNRPLTVSTWARPKIEDGFALRGYTISNEKGEDLVVAETKYVRLDVNTGKPIRITDELYDKYEPEDRAVFEDKMKRLTPPESFEIRKNLSLRKSDLDFNGHVHNTKFLDLAVEGASSTRIKISDVKEINIAYRKPVREGDEVIICSAETETGYFISIDNQNGPCCFVEFTI